MPPEEVLGEGTADLPAETGVLEPTKEAGRILGNIKDGGPQQQLDSELGMPVASTLLEKVRSFSDQREQEKLRAFHRVITVAMLTIALGLALGVVVIALLRFTIPNLREEPILVFGIFAQIVLSSGTVLASTCPLDLLDVDKFGVQYRKTYLVLGLVLCGWQASEAAAFPYLHVSGAITGVGFGIAPLLAPRGPLASTCGVLTFLLGWAATGLVHSFPKRNPVSEDPGVNTKLSDVLAGAHFAWALVGLCVWIWQRCLFHRSNGKKGLSPTVALYSAIYANDSMYAFAIILNGSFKMHYVPEGDHGPNSGILEVVTGVIMLVPISIVLIFGRATVFNFMANRFDMNTARLSRDGAFVANLLDSLPVEVGGRWWVHRDVKDERFPEFDPRRAWREGDVKEVLDEEFVVELLADMDANPMMARTGSGDSPHHDHERTSLRVPLSCVGAGATAEDLLAQAQRGLRCVEFTSLRPDLMMRVDARGNLKLQEEWYSLSRPVQPGEAIDFFVSQSWYDDPEAKWQKLTEVAHEFHRKHGRYPTVWLDKLCLDQAAITDGLKVLPVYVMACRKMLMLCGQTYHSRLWCIWELFTLFAFVSEAAALKRLHFEYLGSHDEGEQILQNLENFHVRDAHCYDPNEESRLRRVISAVGTSLFNERIRSMASAVHKEMLSSSRGPSRGESGRGWRLINAPSQLRTPPTKTPPTPS